MSMGLPTLDDMMRGMPNTSYVACDECDDGIVERVMDDYDAITHQAGYEYLNGCSFRRDTVTIGGKEHRISVELCRDCTAREEAR